MIRKRAACRAVTVSQNPKGMRVGLIINIPESETNGQTRCRIHATSGWNRVVLAIQSRQASSRTPRLATTWKARETLRRSVQEERG